MQLINDFKESLSTLCLSCYKKIDEKTIIEYVKNIHSSSVYSDDIEIIHKICPECNIHSGCILNNNENKNCYRNKFIKATNIAIDDLAKGNIKNYINYIYHTNRKSIVIYLETFFSLIYCKNNIVDFVKYFTEKFNMYFFNKKQIIYTIKYFYEKLLQKKLGKPSNTLHSSFSKENLKLVLLLLECTL